MPFPEASWEVVRLMQVFKLLGEEWRRDTDDALVNFLKGSRSEDEDDTNEANEVNKEWFIREVMDEVIKSVVSVVDGNEGEGLGYATGFGNHFDAPGAISLTIPGL